MSPSPESIVIAGASAASSSSTTGPASRRPTSAMRRETASPCRASSSAFSSTSIHFSLPTSRASSSIASQMRTISECASANASSIVSSGTWSPPASIIVSASRVPTTIRSSVGLVHLLVRRVDDELALDPADAHRADRPEERERRDRERGGGAVDREDVVRHDHVGRQHGADHLHLVLEALRPERPDRAVDHARRERRALGGAALALEEAARDLAGGVHPLLDVDREREEVRVRAARPAARPPSRGSSCPRCERRPRRPPALRACPSRSAARSRPRRRTPWPVARC